MPGETNGWMEYKRLVLKQLEDLTEEVQKLRDDEIHKLRDEIAALRVDVGALKVQAAAWGAVAALIVSAIIGVVVKAM